MRCQPPVVVTIVCIPLLLSAGCTTANREEPHSERYAVEVLAYGIDPSIIPDPLAADFDEDGAVDQLTVGRTSVHVSLSGGGEFSYVIESAADSGMTFDDVKVISLNPDGRYPSIVFATRKRPAGAWYQPHIQQVILNKHGTLVAAYLSAYPMSPRGVDCAWIASNHLPVCFYASHADNDVRMGLSKLLELDVEGRGATDSAVEAAVSGRIAEWTGWFRRLAKDSAFLVYERGRFLADGLSAREMTQEHLHLDGEVFDSVLPEITIPAPAGPVDTFVMVSNDWLDKCAPRDLGRVFWRRGVVHELHSAYDSVIAHGGLPANGSAADYWLAAYSTIWVRGRLYANDLTAQYRLPWPHSYARIGSGTGYHMIDGAFFDFSGDGLLDLVAVGQHSRIFSAVQHPDGYFVEAQYHSIPDEYYRVWAPKQRYAGEVIVPPCVYHAMEPDEAWRSDFVECYDRSRKEWYEAQLPGGIYFNDRVEAVQFWDMNDDGMIDFAAKREGGTWTSFTFVVESG